MKITIAFDFIIPPLQHTSNVASQAAAGVLAISFCFSRRLPTVDEGSSFLRATGDMQTAGVATVLLELLLE